MALAKVLMCVLTKTRCAVCFGQQERQLGALSIDGISVFEQDI